MLELPGVAPQQQVLQLRADGVDIQRELGGNGAVDLDVYFRPAFLQAGLDVGQFLQTSQPLLDLGSQPGQHVQFPPPDLYHQRRRRPPQAGFQRRLLQKELCRESRNPRQFTTQRLDHGRLRETAC